MRNGTLVELLGDEFLILKRLRFDEFQQSVPEQIRVLAVVVPELHLIEVCGKMTGAQVMVRARTRVTPGRAD